MAVPRRSAPAPSSYPPAGAKYGSASELDKYKWVSNIGRGMFGVITKVQRVEDGKTFAMKQVDFSKMEEKDRLQIFAEVTNVASMKHRNIVQFVEQILDPKTDQLYIIMEYCTSGDLGAIIKKAQRSGKPLDEDKIWNIFLQIVLALHYCHYPAERISVAQKPTSGRASVASGAADSISSYQVLHRDLKPDNIFLSDDFVKLGDFGLSKSMGDAAFTNTFVGTPLYMPPEILAGNHYDTKSDIWSLGCLVYEMCALISPFQAAKTQDELSAMVRTGRLPPLPVQYSPALVKVIRAMLTINPAKRPSTNELLNLSEMKLHRKLCTVQNQSAMIASKRAELKQWEERLTARANALSQREKAMAIFEAELKEREAELSTRDLEHKETDRRLREAAQQVRGGWDKLQDEKQRRETMLGLPEIMEQPGPRRTSISNLNPRPPLQDWSTLPIPTRRFSRAGSPLDETPSRLTLSSKASRDQLRNLKPGAITPLRRNETKSMGSIRSQYQAQGGMNRTSVCTPSGGFKKRQSIGTPSEARFFGEDITMATASPASRMGSPAPYHMVQQGDVSMATASPAISHRGSFGGPIVRGPSRLSMAHVDSSAAESDSGRSLTGSPSESQSSNSRESGGTIVAPKRARSPYDPAHATPAKYSLDDPDEELPSPFLRRPSLAAVQVVQKSRRSQSSPPRTEGRSQRPITTARKSTSAQAVPTLEREGSRRSLTRQPLGAINIPNASVGANLGNGEMTAVKGKLPSRPSASLHAQVLKREAARTNEAGRARSLGVQR